MYVTVATPKPTPVTTPPDDVTVNVPVALLLQVPPAGDPVRLVCAFSQTVSVPLMLVGRAPTVTVLVAKQPFADVYVMLVVPPLMPATTPVPFIVPMAVALLIHVPPAVASSRSVVCPTQTNALPVIAAGDASTVTTRELMQPVPSVYTIVVVPAVSPFTTPDASTVPTAVVLLLHVPPAVALSRSVVLPVHTVAAPVMAAGSGLTVTTAVAAHPVDVLMILIVTVPAAMPPTRPVAELTVPTATSDDCQVPPGTGAGMLDNAVVEPTQTAAVPVMGAGTGATVAVATRKQPVGITYETVIVPAERPENSPVAGSIVPTSGKEGGNGVLHAPPARSFDSVVVCPSQIVSVPVMGPGCSFTVTTSVDWQPDVSL